MKYVYVAGPISRGDQFLNKRNAILVADALMTLGFHPYVPHLSASWHLVSPRHYEEWMRLDFAWIERCDWLLRLHGESPGSDREVEHARKHNKPVVFLDQVYNESVSLSAFLRANGVES